MLKYMMKMSRADRIEIVDSWYNSWTIYTLLHT